MRWFLPYALAEILASTNYVHWLLTREPATVTSVLNGVHRPDSFHYQPRAVDFRTWHLEETQQVQSAQLVQTSLGPQFTVILETDPPHLRVARRFAASAADVRAPSASQKAMRASAAD